MTDNKLEILKKILDEAKIENKVEQIRRGPITEEVREYLTFGFQVGRGTENIHIKSNDENLDEIIGSKFIKYRGIEKYEAIWSKDLRCIECGVNVQYYYGSNYHVIRQLEELFREKNYKIIEDAEKNNIASGIVLYENEKVRVSMGVPSNEYMLLSMYKERMRVKFSSTGTQMTIRIENVDVNTQEEAKSVLEKITNSLFFQMDMLYNLVLLLQPRREPVEVRMKKAKKNKMIADSKKKIELNFEYDDIPMALYWLAKSNANSPIFKYFALYQVVEYYYPMYSTRDTKNKIQTLLKDPLFDINEDRDILKLMNVLDRRKNSVNIGDERQQLIITLKSIIEGKDIIEFINNNEELKDYYGGKDAKKLSDSVISLTDQEGIVSVVASRIYDIRCRIVHNKASEVDNKILPMTKDVELLSKEIFLLEYIARKVIVDNSEKFRFE